MAVYDPAPSPPSPSWISTHQPFVFILPLGLVALVTGALCIGVHKCRIRGAHPLPRYHSMLQTAVDSRELV